METLSQNIRTIGDQNQQIPKVCQARCEIFKEYKGYSELIYTVASLGELDQGVREIIVKYLDPGDDICQIVVSPHQPINNISVVGNVGYAIQKWKYDWVLVLTNENLMLFNSAQPDDLPIVQKSLIKNLLTVTWGSILLYSWVEWSWTNGHNVEHALINFNTVSEKPIKETLEYIQAANISDFGISHKQITEQGQIINTLPIKFSNQLSLLLAPREKILATAHYPFNPAIWKSWHGLFRKQERKATPYVAFILTERQFVLIYEDSHDTQSSFGTIIQTIKRKNIFDLLTVTDIEGPQLILLVGDQYSEERIILPAPEECFDEIIEKFRIYFRQ